MFGAAIALAAIAVFLILFSACGLIALGLTSLFRRAGDHFTGDQISAHDLETGDVSFVDFDAREMRNGPMRFTGPRFRGGYMGKGSPDGREPPSGGTSGKRS